MVRQARGSPAARVRRADVAKGGECRARPAVGGAVLSRAHAAAASSLASTMRQVGMFADDPGAELDPSVEQRLDAYADQLEAMSFDFVPLGPED